MEKFIVSRVPRTASSKKRKIDCAENGEKNAPATNKKPPLHLPKRHQMFLDYGQKSFGKHVECPLCGMLYVVGDIVDESSHRANCSKVLV